MGPLGFSIGEVKLMFTKPYQIVKVTFFNEHIYKTFWFLVNVLLNFHVTQLVCQVQDIVIFNVTISLVSKVFLHKITKALG